MATEKSSVKRSFTGICETMFDQMDQLRAHKIQPELANSIARTAAVILKAVSVKYEARRFGDGDLIA